jgi:hypothetical protein
MGGGEARDSTPPPGGCFRSGRLRIHARYAEPTRTGRACSDSRGAR